MHIYLTIKSIVLAIALVAGFSLFFFKVKRLVSLMQAVQGKTVFKLDRIFVRIKILVTMESLRSIFFASEKLNRLRQASTLFL